MPFAKPAKAVEEQSGTRYPPPHDEPVKRAPGARWAMRSA